MSTDPRVPRKKSGNPLQILLTNDDGIRSPGLWAAAEALSELGFVQVVAPRDQFSGAGRSLPGTTDGIIQIQEVEVNGKPWSVYAVGGTPAQVVLHAVLEILPEKPDLVVAGINFGFILVIREPPGIAIMPVNILIVGRCDIIPAGFRK